MEELNTAVDFKAYFTSDAGYIPMHDFRFSLPVMESFAARNAATQPEINLMNQVLVKR